MRALLWKELREIAPWGLLATVAIALGLRHGLYHTEYGSIAFDTHNGVTLTRKAFLFVTTFGFPVVGLLFGFRQFLPELKADRWATLLHRPVSRETILAGKLVIAVVTYALAAGAPFLIAALWAARPGSFAAPFVPGLVLPGLADLSVGLAYYFAAVLACLNRSGGVAVRALAVAAAVYLSYVAVQSKEFHTAAGAAAALAAGLILAATGAIRHPSDVALRPALTRVAFFVVAFYGICGIGALLESLGHVIGPKPKHTWDTYRVTKDGLPVRVTYENGVLIRLSRVDGTPIDDPDLSPANVRNNFVYENMVTRVIGDPHGWKPSPYQPGYRQPERFVRSMGSYDFPSPEIWFEVVETRSLVGYSPATNLPTAQFDARGFVPVGSPPDGLAEGVELDQFNQAMLFLWDSSEAVVIRLPERRIEAIPLPADAPIAGAATLWVQTPNGSLHFFAISLERELHLFDNAFRPLAVVPYSRDVDRLGRVSVGICAEGAKFFLLFDPSAWIPAKESREMTRYLDVFDLDGTLIESHALPPLPGRTSPPSLVRRIATRIAAPVFFFGEMFYRKVGSELGSERLRTALENQWGTGRTNTVQTSFWVIGLSVFCAAGGVGLGLVWRIRRLALVAWGLTILALNVGGLVLFLLAARRPVHVRCPACGVPRAVDGETCPACGAGWPRPVPNELGILQPH